MGRLRTDLDILKLNSILINEGQRSALEKRTEDVFQKKNLLALIDQQMNALSSEFTKAIDELSEKLQGVLDRVSGEGTFDFQIPEAVQRDHLRGQCEGDSGQNCDAAQGDTRIDRLSPGQMILTPRKNSP
jgi:hypothetical protein